MIGGMGNVAAAIYLDRLIALRDLKVKAVHLTAGVKPGYISRVISGNIKEPSAAILHALTIAVDGSWEDVGALLDSRATKEQAEALAEAWYRRLMKTNGSQRDVLRERLQSAIKPLLEDPEQLDRFLRS